MGVEVTLVSSRFVVLDDFCPVLHGALIFNYICWHAGTYLIAGKKEKSRQQCPISRDVVWRAGLKWYLEGRFLRKEGKYLQGHLSWWLSPELHFSMRSSTVVLLRAYGKSAPCQVKNHGTNSSWRKNYQRGGQSKRDWADLRQNVTVFADVQPTRQHFWKNQSIHQDIAASLHW